MTIRAFAALEKGKSLEPFSFEPKPLAPHEVEVKISHCGVCHSDLHLVNNDWGMSSYPLVPGHEVIGTVHQVGSGVTQLKPGQRVGIGWQSDSCGQCEWCTRGEENLCAKAAPTCVGRHGGFADFIRVNGRFAIPVPESLSSESAAPLLCGGITVFSPMRGAQLGAQHRVGIIGIGGLGHMALQFARAFGSEVTAFSTSADKEAEAKRMGAHHFIATRDRSALKKLRGLVRLHPLHGDRGPALAGLRVGPALRTATCASWACRPRPERARLRPHLQQQAHLRQQHRQPRACREMLQVAARNGVRRKPSAFPLAQVNRPSAASPATRCATAPSSRSAPEGLPRERVGGCRGNKRGGGASVIVEKPPPTPALLGYGAAPPWTPPTTSCSRCCWRAASASASPRTSAPPRRSSSRRCWGCSSPTSPTSWSATRPPCSAT